MCKLIYVYLSLASSGSLCSKEWVPRGDEEMNCQRNSKERYSNDSIKLSSSKENDPGEKKPVRGHLIYFTNIDLISRYLEHNYCR